MEYSEGRRVFVKTGYSDLRKQIDGLLAIVQRYANAKMVFNDSSYYLFCNKNRTIIKILFWDFDGFCLMQKKSDVKYFFSWITEANKLLEIDTNLARQLFHGINIWERVTIDKKEKDVRPDKETLKKVIEERMNDNSYAVRSGYIDGESGRTLYLDKKGLIHKDGPNGEIIDFIGFTNEQRRRLDGKGGGSEGISPMPR